MAMTAMNSGCLQTVSSPSSLAHEPGKLVQQLQHKNTRRMPFLPPNQQCQSTEGN